MTLTLIDSSQAVHVDMQDVQKSWSTTEVENIRPLDEREDNSLLLPTTHRIVFLSHSGHQKSFAEQLYWDLKNRGHTVFFDKSNESLPTGKEFPKLILQAARQCVVAVVVLSEDYLMSKWPMLELLAFVDAKRTCNPTMDILPLFYKLDVCDLNNTAAIQRWRAKWQNLAVDPEQCLEALRVLARSKGERYCLYASKVDYRKSIVAGLDRFYRPTYFKYATPPMVGRRRLCQMITGELARQSRVNGHRPPVLGLYGLGGMGKTLLCKALCSHYLEEYSGRVCHAECSKPSGRLELLKLILDELTDVDKIVKPFIRTEQEALSLVCANLHREAVFLAVDNVQECDLQWLRSIFHPDCKHNSKSKFVVTSRCVGNVQSIVRDKDCWAVPSLTENEGLALFVRSADPTLRIKIPCSRYTELLESFKNCIEEHFFSSYKQDPPRSSASSQNAGGHYNPMLLQTLGSSLKGTDFAKPQDLIQKCRMWGKLEHFHKHPVFDILRTEYDKLNHQRCKLMFLDTALFAPREKLRKLEDLCTWLEGMHDCTREEILHNLRKLKRSSLVEDWEANTQSQMVTLHDLYKGFAAYELQVLEADKRWVVYHTSGLSDLPQNLEGSPPGRNWPDLVRVCLRIENQRPGAAAGHQHQIPVQHLQVLKSVVLASPPVAFPSREKIQQWENVQLLHLEGFESSVLDIAPLQCLRSLKLVSYELQTLKGCRNLKQLRFVDLTCSGLREGLDFSHCSKLQELVTGDVYALRTELCLPLGSTTSPASTDLKTLKFPAWNKSLPPVLDLGNNAGLREVEIAHTIWDNIAVGGGNYGASSSCSSSSWGDWSLCVLGLRFLTSLVALTLVKLPVSSLPGLENLVALESLIVRGCAKLEVMPDLSALPRLAQVDRHGCEQLPDDQPWVSRNCTVWN